MPVQVRVHLRDKAFASEISEIVSKGGVAEVKCSTFDEIAPFIRDLSEEMLLVVDHNEVDVRSLLDTLSYQRKCPSVIILNSRDPDLAKAHLANSVGFSRATLVPRTNASQVASHINSLVERRHQSYSLDNVIAMQAPERAAPDRQLIFDPLFIEDLLEQAPVGVLVTTLDYKVQYINTYGADLLACHEVDAIGQFVPDLAPSLSKKLIEKAENQTEASAAGSLEVEMIQLNTRRVLSLRVAPLSDPQGSLRRKLIILQDATVKTDALIQSTQASEAKSQFLANASHELRTPLNAILGYAELLKMMEDKVDHATLKQYAENISAGGTHLLSIANDLIDLAKLESRSLDVFLQDVDAQKVAEECVQLTEPIALRNSVTVSLEPANGDSRVVIADLLRLKQCILNLLSNAIKYSVDAGNVSIRLTRSADGLIEIFVEDDGIGIPKKTQANLFDMFVTSNQAAPKAHERGGLGLHLTKQLVESMFGSISFESREGRGSTFCLRFPAADNPDLPL